MTTTEIVSFLQENPSINLLLGDAVKNQKISASFLFTLVAIISYAFVGLMLVVGYLLKKKWTWPWALLKNPVEFIRSPVDFVINFSANLLKDPIAAHYEGIDRRKWIRKYWLHAVGASVVIFAFYGFALSILQLTNGIALDTVSVMVSGDYNQRAELLRGYVLSNPLLNSTVLVVVFTAILAIARVRFLETEHWNKQKAGLVLSIPIAQWDETPKFTKPDDEFLKEANNSILKILDSGKVDMVRTKVASGFDCFGPEGFLTELLKRSNKTWRILLMNPDSEGAKRRANQYFSERASDKPEQIKSPDDYLNGIRETINRILEIKNKNNPNITLKVYDHTPQWRLIIASGLSFVKGFGPGQRSDRATVNLFETKSTSLFHSYFEMFEDIWHHDSNEVLSPFVISKTEVKTDKSPS